VRIPTDRESGEIKGYVSFPGIHGIPDIHVAWSLKFFWFSTFYGGLCRGVNR